MDKLWAPWRIKYISQAKLKKCIFCSAGRSRAKNQLILKTRFSIAMLNIFPYTNGHIMVSPLKHTGELARLTDAELLDLLRTVNKMQGLLDKVLKPQGYNIGINISRSAGAGITGHLHIHIVPRWIGDTNFMPVLHNTKIISQSLDELYRRLKDAQSK